MRILDIDTFVDWVNDNADECDLLDIEEVVSLVQEQAVEIPSLKPLSDNMLNKHRKNVELVHIVRQLEEDVTKLTALNEELKKKLEETR